jgi:ATP-dependent Clp protease ATP-binding subunit ClpB
VLLFDEVEKAHQDVFNLLLQVLDDGRLTDGRGRLADFTNTVVIMTSNIGSRLSAGNILEPGRSSPGSPSQLDTETGVEDLRGTMRAELGNFFRPEFLNRIGDIVIFGELSLEHLERIADIQLGKVQKLLDGRGLSLSVSAEAKRRLVELGHEPGFGARPLERSIVRHVQDPVAEGLLAGKFTSGQTIAIVLDGERIAIAADAPRAAP